MKRAAGFWKEVGGDLRRGVRAVAGEDVSGLEDIWDMRAGEGGGEGQDSGDGWVWAQRDVGWAGDYFS
jgi:hypothetical protein